MERCGPYQVQGELGRGAFGVVLRARDPEGREVALKLMHALPDAGDRERFARELEALTRVADPGLVRVLAADAAGPRPWLALELVPGETLAARLARHGPLDTGQALAIGAALAATLARLHARGVVHRDLKPGNVILRPDGRPVLLDLGLALLLDRSARLTRTGELLGTPSWMAPEQAQGVAEAVGPAADVYGLGAVLYGLLTGQPPFPGSQPLEVLRALLTGTPAPPSRLRPGLDPRLEALVLRCLARDPLARPAADELLEALEALRRQPRSPRTAARPVTALALAAALLLGGGGLAGWVLLAEGGPAPAPAQDARATALRLIEAGHERVRAGDLAGSIARYDEALIADPTCALAFSFRGGIRMKQGDLASAAGDQAQALRLDPRLAEAWANRGAIRQRQGELTGARQDLERALELAPELAEAWVSLGGVLHQQGDGGAALAAFDRGVALDPGLGPGWAGRAVVLEGLGRQEEALRDYARALELSPRAVLYRVQRAGLLAQRGELVRALADYDLALELAPDDGEALVNRAQTRRIAGDLAGAREDLERFLRLLPGNAMGWLERGRLRATSGDMEGARTDWRRVLELDPAGRAGDKAREYLAR